jgi:thymidylate synthase (FAD)
MENFQRYNNPEFDHVLGTSFKVLDEGFIRVIDYMGTDESIVQAARVSYGKGTKKTSEDQGLIRYLIRNHHTTPFEMCEIKLHLRLPMDCWRQWIRHRTANVNEYSTRYSIAIDAIQKTSYNEWRIQSKTNKQGSDIYLNEENGKILSNRELFLHSLAREIYQERIERGVAREQARKDLPLSTYTEAYWKIDLHNLLHFLSLRMESHAQYEIRQYANVIGKEIVKKWCPIAWEAFLDYRLNSISLSRIEISLFSLLNMGKIKEVIKEMQKIYWIDNEHNFISNRERVEFESKLPRLGIDNFRELIKGQSPFK